MSDFRAAIQAAATAAAREWHYDDPRADFYESFNARIPANIRDDIARGIQTGRVTLHGFGFSLPDLGPQKGPYAFFSQNRGHGVPSPNWEYFVQLAEYLRVSDSVPSHHAVGFEDDLMDVSVRNAGALLWYVEVKEKASQAEHLLAALVTHASAVAVAAPDRGNDPLRKAKYLARHRPPYFSVVAANYRRDFDVAYPTEDSFVLEERATPPRLGDAVDFATDPPGPANE